MVFSQPLRGRCHAPIPLFARGTSMQNVVIVGTGLIGSSFGLALRKAGFDGAITGVSSPHAIADALARGAIDRGASLASAIPDADLVFLSQTIGRILDTIRHLDPLLSPGTCLLYTSPSPRDGLLSRMPSSA